MRGEAWQLTDITVMAESQYASMAVPSGGGAPGLSPPAAHTSAARCVSRVPRGSARAQGTHTVGEVPSSCGLGLLEGSLEGDESKAAESRVNFETHEEASEEGDRRAERQRAFHGGCLHVSMIAGPPLHRGSWAK